MEAVCQVGALFDSRRVENMQCEESNNNQRHGSTSKEIEKEYTIQKINHYSFKYSKKTTHYLKTILSSSSKRK